MSFADVIDSAQDLVEAYWQECRAAGFSSRDSIEILELAVAELRAEELELGATELEAA